MAFIKSLMAKILIVEYNPNDMVVVVAREFEEQQNYFIFFTVTNVEPMLHSGTLETIRKPIELLMFSEAPKMHC